MISTESALPTLPAKRLPDGGLPLVCPSCGVVRIFSSVPGAMLGVFYHNYRCALQNSDSPSPEDFAEAIEEEFGEDWYD